MEISIALEPRRNCVSIVLDAGRAACCAYSVSRFRGAMAFGEKSKFPPKELVTRE